MGGIGGGALSPGWPCEVLSGRAAGGKFGGNCEGGFTAEGASGTSCDCELGACEFWLGGLSWAKAREASTDNVHSTKQAKPALRNNRPKGILQGRATVKKLGCSNCLNWCI